MKSCLKQSELFSVWTCSEISLSLKQFTVTISAWWIICIITEQLMTVWESFCLFQTCFLSLWGIQSFLEVQQQQKYSVLHPSTTLTVPVDFQTLSMCGQQTLNSVTLRMTDSSKANRHAQTAPMLGGYLWRPGIVGEQWRRRWRRGKRVCRKPGDALAMFVY